MLDLVMTIMGTIAFFHNFAAAAVVISIYEGVLLLIAKPYYKKKNLDYDLVSWVESGRNFLLKFSTYAQFNSGFINVICLNEDKEGLITKEKACVALFTHGSNVDPPLVTMCFPARIYMVAKKSLRKVPVFGFAAVKINMIPIDRTNRDNAMQTMKGAEDFMSYRKIGIAMAPEGTRRRKLSDTDDHSKNLMEFKKGPFHLAKNTNTFLAPVILYGANRIMQPGSF